VERAPRSATAARIGVLERRDVRQAVVVELWIVSIIFALMVALLGRESLVFAAAGLGAVACLLLITVAWRRGGRRHPHLPAFLIGVVIMVTGAVSAFTTPLLSETMVGMFAVVVVGCAALMPWGIRWHIAFLAMSAITVTAVEIIRPSLGEYRQVAMILVDASAIVASLAGNWLAIQRRRRRWLVELELRTQRVALRRTLATVQAAQSRIERLEGILPICAHCKRIREGDRWEPMEVYLASRTEAQFSHGICPDCMARLYSEYT
jgi:hypothetical protein